MDGQIPLCPVQEWVLDCSMDLTEEDGARSSEGGESANDDETDHGDLFDDVSAISQVDAFEMTGGFLLLVHTGIPLL